MKERTQRLKRAALKALNYVIDRLSEASTLRAFIVIGASTFGYVYDPELLESYVLVGVVVAQAIAATLPDKIEAVRKRKKNVDVNDSTKDQS